MSESSQEVSRYMDKKVSGLNAEPPDKGHVQLGPTVLSTIERLSSSRRLKIENGYYKLSFLERLSSSQRVLYRKSHCNIPSI